uniref:Glutaredoxin-related protein 5, mitochondrial n=1 Tax=Ditylenchus dipsaci TaxID=166011 RepID=A0A915D786_9BILA
MFLKNSASLFLRSVCSKNVTGLSNASSASRLFSCAAMRASSDVNDSSSNHITKDRIDGYVHDKNNQVVVFMKGTKHEPMCGFSRNVKLILDFHQVNFKDYNVLEDEDLRQGVKEYSDWPTIPQVYVKGEFVGGSDVLAKMHSDGEITAFFDEKGIPSKFSDVMPPPKKGE